MTRINFKRLVKRRIPIVGWLPSYNGADGLGDLIAGLTVGLTLIPQAIAYASLAGLSAQYGLYSSFAGSLVYILFGTCREVNIGPTAVISLLTYTYARGIPEYATLLCFLSGCVTVTLAIFRLGFLVEFVSTPVVSGFTSAVSVIVACSQIKGLLGVKIEGERFLEIWRELYEKINESRMPDLILSCCCIIALLTLKSLKDLKASNPAVRKIFWFLGIGRNAIVVIISTGISRYYETHEPEGAPFLLTGHVEKGFPNVEPPVFNFVQGNGTISFVEMTSNLGSGIIVVPIISLIGNVAIAKAFCEFFKTIMAFCLFWLGTIVKARGQVMDASQEMLTLGFCNIAGSFFHSMPVSGSFSRSAVNNASGVRTTMGGLYTGILVVLALTFLTPYFYYIPRATLSSVIICAVIFMVEFGILQPIWKCSKRDIVPGAVTFFACLFAPVELGILVGVAVDIAILVYFNARPKIYVESRSTAGGSYLLVRPSSGLQFPAVNYLKTRVTKSLFETRRKDEQKFRDRPRVVLDCEHVDKIDFTALQGLSEVIHDLNKENGHLVLFNPTDQLSRNLQSLLNKPILTAHSDMELSTILSRMDDYGDRNDEKIAENIDTTNNYGTKHLENSSTDL